MTWEAFSALAGMFAAAFGAATILPFQSEVVFAAIAYGDIAPIWLIVAVASVGNTLGSVLNYWMGLFVERWRDSRWFPVKPSTLERTRAWYAKYGVWSLLLSWAPFADGLTVAAGIMRTPFWLFLALVSFAKTARYVAIALFFL